MERDGHATTATSTCNYDTEAEIDEVILRLDLTLVRPDDEDSSRLQSTDSTPNDVDATGTQNGGTNASETSDTSGQKARTNKSYVDSSSSSQHDEDKKRSKPLDFIRKLRQTGLQTDNYRNGSSADSAGRRKSPEPLKVCDCYSLLHLQTAKRTFIGD